MLIVICVWFYKSCRDCERNIFREQIGRSGRLDQVVSLKNVFGVFGLIRYFLVLYIGFN